MTLAERLLEHGIRLPSYGQGGHKIVCPQCSHTRRHKADPYLSVTVDDDSGAVWNCHHCGWTGNVGAQDHDAPVPSPRPRKPKPVKPAFTPGTLPEGMVEWFANRGISRATLEAAGVTRVQTWMPGCAPGATVGAIAFPYRRNGEVVNVKYRTRGKRFRQEKDAEKVFYNLDGIAGAREAIIVEGEIDALSLLEAGFVNVLSVPDGAPQRVREGDIDPEDDAKFAYVWNCRTELAGVEKIVIATDAYGPGKALAEELARRFGRERCLRVEWLAADGNPRKDANEVLVNDGPVALRDAIASAKPWPIRSLHDADDFREAVLSLYRDGRQRARSTGWTSLDPYMTIREGELSVVTGIPNSGKSEFIDALMVNLACDHGWRFAVCSFENPPDEHLSKLAEKYTMTPFWDGPRPRMTEAVLARTLDVLRERFFFIRADDVAPTLDWVLEAAAAAVMRYGIRGLVIDPWNEIEHHRPANMTETEYVSHALGMIKRFAARHGVHVWLVAHPAKMQREAGKFPVPTLYDISGSANFANKADLGVVVYRVPEAYPPRTEIHIRKCRFKSVGRLGMVTLAYDTVTGRYSDISELPASRDDAGTEHGSGRRPRWGGDD
ncbi:AAA family ATPase [Azospirillum brasilense]|nr:AAA family ATPase [Azospirillum brasilense]